MTHGDVKNMILTCATFEAADQVMQQYTYCKTDRDRIVYLRNLFNIHSETPAGVGPHEQYVDLLTQLVSTKAASV
jgi:hypothetical protein